jgi:hypothetical protein
MMNPRHVDARNEGVATKKGGHMEYALVHTPNSTYHSISLSYLILSYLILSYLIT